VPVAFLGVLFVWPLFEVFRRTLDGSDDSLELLGRPSTLRIFRFTVGQALASTLLTFLIGLPIAHGLARYRFFGRSAVRAMVVVPFVLPTLVVAAAFQSLFGVLGLASGRWDLDQSLLAVLMAHVFFNIAVVVRVVGGFWTGLSRRTVEAARVLGASRSRAFREVTLPQLLPVIAGAALVVFLFSVTSFGLILILGGPTRATVETEIYRQAVNRLDFNAAAVLALVQLGVVLVLSAFAGKLQRRFAGASQRDGANHARPVDTRSRRVHLVGVLGLAAVVVGGPLAALIERSLRVGDGYGLANFTGLTDEIRLLPISPMEALGNSLKFALAAALVASLVGMLASRVIVSGGWLGRLLEAAAFVPLGTSAVTLGLGYLLAFAAFDLRRSVWLVPAAHAVIGLPFVLGAVVPVLRSIDETQRHAAAILGASPWRVWWEVDRPVASRAMVTGAGFAVAVSIGEFGATSFLSRGADSFTAPLAIFRLLSQPGDVLRGQSMALSVVIGLVVAVVALLLEFRRGDGVSVL